MKIAVGGIHTECSTYSPLQQTADDFKVVRGKTLLEQCGLLEERFSGVTFSPLFHARSIPGGPVKPDCYSAFKTQFLQDLEAALPVNGVLLIMHGAMHVPGLEDAEGDWIASVRQLVGPAVPIAVSYDLHGNVTQEIIDQIDIFCAYRTAPHIDVRATHVRAALELADQLRGGQPRLVAYAPVPVLLPGEKTSTEDEPTRSLYNTLPDFDQRSGVNDANLMVGYVWADAPRATAAAVVTGTDKVAVLQAAEEIAEAYWHSRARFDFGVPTKPLSACLEDATTTETSPFILADSGDNPTGGGVGDRADVLSEWISRGLTDAVFAGIADPAAVERAWTYNEGDEAQLTIGGALGSSCARVSATCRIIAKLGQSSSGDRELLVTIRNNHVILTERRRPFHALDDFRRFGLEPEKARFLIVKSGYLSPELAPLANPARMALTEGSVSQDICGLENRHRQSPCFPFQSSFDWKAKAIVSARAPN